MMDSKCRAWRLRSSSEMWRPNKHVFSNANPVTGRRKLSSSDSDFKFPAMVRENEKSLQAKWNSSPVLRDTSSMSVGSKSPSPILRCRTASPDLCRTISADRARFDESDPQAQDYNEDFPRYALGRIEELINAGVRIGVHGLSWVEAFNSSALHGLNYECCK